ncbi:hypothetical protein [Roseateles saccharophilus]|uniref:Uncharacterized protein n=1 Tax=Roseateles saccharophilus TaxID=304 RepID=A0A4R3UHA5_ROSSA|nr:hypothetical protein [Roseateles saccharophilus]MDG0835047.1 hypothetical protein [Roseateles saccharophilus]TCU88309.1 hypothetical protein EV671_104128 [Roseateles saccharophilus]
MNFKASLCAAAAALTLSFPAFAQESSYTQGSVWFFSNIQIEPGQFENYMDYLGANWKKVQELGKKEGIILSYHVLSVNAQRNGEPDLILAVELKDYRTKAQGEAFQKKVEALLAADARQQTSASGQRGTMRKLVGNMELQELVLK